MGVGRAPFSEMENVNGEHLEFFSRTVLILVGVPGMSNIQASCLVVMSCMKGLNLV